MRTLCSQRKWRFSYRELRLWGCSWRTSSTLVRALGQEASEIRKQCFPVLLMKLRASQESPQATWYGFPFGTWSSTSQAWYPPVVWLFSLRNIKDVFLDLSSLGWWQKQVKVKSKLGAMCSAHPPFFWRGQWNLCDRVVMLSPKTSLCPEKTFKLLKLCWVTQLIEKWGTAELLPLWSQKSPGGGEGS